MWTSLGLARKGDNVKALDQRIASGKTVSSSACGGFTLSHTCTWTGVNCQVPELYFLLAKAEDVKRKTRTTPLEHANYLKARDSPEHS